MIWGKINSGQCFTTLFLNDCYSIIKYQFIQAELQFKVFSLSKLFEFLKFRLPKLRGLTVYDTHAVNVELMAKNKTIQFYCSSPISLIFCYEKLPHA